MNNTTEEATRQGAVPNPVDSNIPESQGNEPAPAALPLNTTTSEEVIAEIKPKPILKEDNDRPTPLGTPPRKRSKMTVTWDDERKLRKKSYPAGFAPIETPPTPEPTPTRPAKPSLFSRLTGKTSTPTYPSSAAVQAPPSPPPSPTPGWKHHDSYFPEYTPIYPSTTFADPYARPYLLTPAEMQAQQHVARVGHAVAVHYPMLPPFDQYSGGAAKGQGAWQSGQWGSSNWTGFGLNGERLPDGEGKTFGAPMPKGVAAEGAKGGAAKKGKAGGGGGEEGGAGEGEQGGVAEGGGGGGEAGGDAAAEPAAAEGGGGTSKKKKKK